VKSTNTHKARRTHTHLNILQDAGRNIFLCMSSAIRLYSLEWFSRLDKFLGRQMCPGRGEVLLRPYNKQKKNKKKEKKKTRDGRKKHQDNRKKWSRMFGVESQEIDFFSWFGPRTQDPEPGIRDLPLRRCQTEFIDDWFALCAYLSQCRFYLHDWGVRGAIIALACI